MKTLILLICLSIFCGAATANPLGKAWHYINSHKELLASDVILAAAFSADAASTRFAEINCPSCIETAPFIGQHPNTIGVWGTAAGYTMGTVTLNHLLWHYAPDKSYRHIIWIWTIPVALNDGIYVIPNNVRAGSR